MARSIDRLGEVMLRLAVLALVAATAGCLRSGAPPSSSAPSRAAAVEPGAAAGDDDEATEPGDPDADEPDPEANPAPPADEPPDATQAGAGASKASFRAPLVFPRPSPATRIGKLSPGACMKELASRALPFTRSKQAASGVATALRSTGPLRGVRIVIPRAPSPFGVVDCRLALALDETARVLAEHGVVEIRIDNAYRPRARLPGKASRSQHAYGLAADVTSLRLADGRVLGIEDDWHAPIGSMSCGPDAVMESPTPASIALRDIVCDVARIGVFHHILTPSWDAAHRNHLHLDLQRDASRQAMH